MVKQIQPKRNRVLKKTFLTEISQSGKYENFETLFDMESELFRYINELKKEKAQKLARCIVSHLLKNLDGNELSNEEKFQYIRYYLLALCAIFTRQFVQQHMTPRKAVALNDICYHFLKKEVSEKNVLHVADELIELFLYLLAEQTAPDLMHDTVNDVIAYIDDEIESSLTVEGITKRFNLSTSHLSRIFHEHTNITLVEYINIRKVEEAQYHLRFTDKKISDISDRFSFCNQSYFTRIFKKYTDETPRRFRYNIKSRYFHYHLRGTEKRLSSDESL